MFTTSNEYDQWVVVVVARKLGQVESGENLHLASRIAIVPIRSRVPDLSRQD